jgi:four helix bundle protein
LSCGLFVHKADYYECVMVVLKSYQDLIVWQKSMILAKKVYLLTENFPKCEIYGLVSQMRRASVAIPSNIAEGYGRKSSKEYVQFYRIAYGSALELETQLILSTDLGFLREEECKDIQVLLTEVQKMLYVMIRRLNSEKS